MKKNSGSIKSALARGDLRRGGKFVRARKAAAACAAGSPLMWRNFMTDWRVETRMAPTTLET